MTHAATHTEALALLARVQLLGLKLKQLRGHSNTARYRCLRCWDRNVSSLMTRVLNIRIHGKSARGQRASYVYGECHRAKCGYAGFNHYKLAWSREHRSKQRWNPTRSEHDYWPNFTLPGIWELGK